MDVKYPWPVRKADAKLLTDEEKAEIDAKAYNMALGEAYRLEQNGECSIEVGSELFKRRRLKLVRELTKHVADRKRVQGNTPQ